MQKTLPGSVKDKLENSAAYVRERAQQRGAVCRLEFEIFNLGAMAQEALDKESADLAREVLAYEQTLLTLISDSHSKPSYSVSKRVQR